MITGSASVEALAEGAATVKSWGTEPWVLDDVVLVQAMFELRSGAREAVLPPALHPTNPPTAVVQVWSGPFSLVQVRVQCRSGLRPRGFVTGAACDSDDAVARLAAGWGFACRAAPIEVRRGYDETSVVTDGLVLRLRDPDPLDPGDVNHSSTLNLAHTPNGLRLVQLDLTTDLERVERVQPAIEVFDAEAWGSPLLDPWYPVAATVAFGRLTLPPVRFCCRPDVLAFEGTETVESATSGT